MEVRDKDGKEEDKDDDEKAAEGEFHSRVGGWKATEAKRGRGAFCEGGGDCW